MNGEANQAGLFSIRLLIHSSAMPSHAKPTLLRRKPDVWGETKLSKSVSNYREGLTFCWFFLFVFALLQQL